MRVLELHPVALVEEVHRIVGVVLQRIGLSDLVGAQRIGHIALRPGAKLREHGLAGTERLLAVDVHRGHYPGVVCVLEFLHRLAPHIFGQVVHIVLERAASTVQQRHERPWKVAVGQRIRTFGQFALEVLDLIDGHVSVIQDVLQIVLFNQVLVVIDGHLEQIQWNAVRLAIDGHALPCGGQEAALLQFRRHLLPIIHGVDQPLGLQHGSLELVTDDDVGDVLAGLHHGVDLRGQIIAVHRLEYDFVIALPIVFLNDALHGRTIIADQIVPEINGLVFARGRTAASGRDHKTQRRAYCNCSFCETPQSRETS